MPNQAKTKPLTIAHSAQAVVNRYVTYAETNSTMSAFRLEYVCSFSSEDPWYGLQR